jgi:glycosyltransferase involved in cell wall biosynthesis
MAKKKILLLSDDMRMHSGIATVSRDIVLNTVAEYDWIQVGAAIEHPDMGKLIDISDDVKKLTGVSDANVRIIPYNGYGDPLLIREVMKRENPDVIMHFTDPRFWDWLYEMEHEIRQQVPLVYLNIWDDLPDPMYNKEAYSSCDLLMAISKQTYGINTRILTRYEGSVNPDRITYVPHGISDTDFFPVDETHEKYNDLLAFKKQVFNNVEYDFIVFWNNRNIRRKQPGDVVLAFKEFVERLPVEKRDKCLLLMHTQPIDHNGTHIPELIKEVAPDIKVAFSDKAVPREYLNYMYNIADVTINISSNEGFGLATAESVMAGTPIIVNVTGGLQDQCGFSIIENETQRYLNEDDYVEIGSLHDYRKWKNNDKLTYGEWAYPVWPASLSLQGSVPTPYIFDDRVDFVDAADRIYEVYMLTRKERKDRGLKGREYMTSDQTGLSVGNMGNRVINSINTCITNFKKRNRFTLIKI